MPSGSIHDDHFEFLFLELHHALSSDRDGVGFGVGTEVRYFGFCGGLASLVKGAGTEGVCADDAGFEAAFLVIDCQLRVG